MYVAKYVIHIIINTLYHITASFSPQRISSLRLILESWASTGFDMEKGMYYSQYIIE